LYYLSLRSCLYGGLGAKRRQLSEGMHLAYFRHLNVWGNRLLLSLRSG
jgi:hypothetical protein